MNPLNLLKGFDHIYILENTLKDSQIESFKSAHVFDQIMNQLDLPYRSSHFNFNQCGKPYLSDNPLYFSITHSGKMMLIALSLAPIAIDCEQHFNINKKHILKRILNSQEVNFVESSREPKQAFFDIWCKKEALLKYFGVGLTIDPRSFSVFQENDPVLKALSIQTSIPIPKHITQLALSSDYSVSLIHHYPIQSHVLDPSTY